MQSYHVAPNGQQEGPHDLSHLEAMMKAGRLQASDLCWQEGMANWQPVSEVLPSLSTQNFSSPPPILNPYEAPKTPWGNHVPEIPVPRVYGGIGRLVFIGASILVNIFTATAATLAKNEDFQMLMLPLGLIIGLVLIAYRMKNIGISCWYLLLLVVPVINGLFALSLLIYTLLAPEGYAQTRKLDKPVKIILWILLGFVVLSILLSLISRFFT